MDNFSKQLKNLPFMSFEEADNFLNNLNKDDLSYSLDFLIPKKTPNIIHLIKKHINKIDLKENDGLLFKICFYDNFEIFNFLKETDPNFKNLLYFFALNCSSDKNNKITKYFLKNHFDLFKNPNILKYKLLDFNSKDLNLILKSTSDEEKKILIEESFICNLFTNINYDNFNNEEDFLNDLEKKVRVINKNIPEYNYLGFLILLKNKELFLKFKNKYNLDIISYYLINSNSESKHINFIEELISQKQKNKIISSIKITDKQSKKRKI